MNSIRDVPWVYYLGAVLAFFVVVTAAAGLTMVLAPAPPVVMENKFSIDSQDHLINYLPLVRRIGPTCGCSTALSALEITGSP